jgi:hypothetical protein
MNESAFKTKITKAIRADKLGYARRLEDSFAVGVYDVIIIPNKQPVYFVEAKLLKKGQLTWGPTPRQLIELERVQVGYPHAIPIMVAYWPEKEALIADLPRAKLDARAPIAAVTGTTEGSLWSYGVIELLTMYRKVTDGGQSATGGGYFDNRPRRDNEAEEG